MVEDNGHSYQVQIVSSTLLRRSEERRHALVRIPAGRLSLRSFSL